jgi:hypothetical protein
MASCDALDTDGRVLAKKMDNGGPVDIVVFANGARETNLTADWDYLPSQPFWSPDGKYIYFTGGLAARPISSASRRPAAPSSKSRTASVA